jgi:hypothetical protein
VFEIDNGKAVRPFGTYAYGSLISMDMGLFSAHLIRRHRPELGAADRVTGAPREVEASFKGSVSCYGSYILETDGG